MNSKPSKLICQITGTDPATGNPATLNGNVKSVLYT
jgi:hypothetical protein